MKLTYISTARIPSEKANTYQILQMCDAFAEQGIDISLLYPKRQNIPEMRQVNDLHSYYGLHNDFKIISLPSFDLIYLTGRIFAFAPRIKSALQNRLFPLLLASYRSAVLRYLPAQAADMYYTRSPELSAALVHNRSMPKIASRLALEIHAFPASPAEQQALKKTHPHLSGIVTITQQLKSLCVQQGISEEKILVAPDGVDLQRFTACPHTDIARARQMLNLPQDRYIIGYVGRLQTLGQEKGIPDLIKALIILSQSQPSLNIALCCVGGPDDMIQQYRRFALEQGLQSEQAIFTSSVPPAQVPLYLSAFNVCAMPFPWTQHYAYYMSPLKLFEYMASNRPILATRLPSVEEILQHEHNALLAQPGDPQSIADNIAQLAGKPALAEKIAGQAFTDVQAYTWTQRAANILAFISERIRS